MFWEFLFKLFRLEWSIPRCEECDHLRLLVEQERAEKSRILSQLLEINRPTEIREEYTDEELKPIKSKYVPFAITKQQLELQDRLRAEGIRNTERLRQANAIKNLEEELGVDNAS